MHQQLYDTCHRFLHDPSLLTPFIDAITDAVAPLAAYEKAHPQEFWIGHDYEIRIPKMDPAYEDQARGQWDRIRGPAAGYDRHLQADLRAVNDRLTYLDIQSTQHGWQTGQWYTQIIHYRGKSVPLQVVHTPDEIMVEFIPPRPDDNYDPIIQAPPEEQSQVIAAYLQSYAQTPNPGDELLNAMYKSQGMQPPPNHDRARWLAGTPDDDDLRSIRFCIEQELASRDALEALIHDPAAYAKALNPHNILCNANRLMSDPEMARWHRLMRERTGRAGTSAYRSGDATVHTAILKWDGIEGDLFSETSSYSCGSTDRVIYVPVVVVKGAATMGYIIGTIYPKIERKTSHGPAPMLNLDLGSGFIHINEEIRRDYMLTHN